MNKNQKGFSAVEIVFVLVVLVLVAGVGWYFVQRNDTKQATSSKTEQTVETKSYTDSAKLYSVSYPSSWAAEEEADCCGGGPKDYTKVSRGVNFIPPNKADMPGYGLNIQADNTDSLAERVEQNWKDNKHEPEPKTVNGYSAQYVKVTFNGDAEHYIDHHYLITHNGVSVYATLREKYYHQYPAADWSAAKDMAAFNAALNSIKFLN